MFDHSKITGHYISVDSFSTVGRDGQNLTAHVHVLAETGMV